MSEKLIRVAVLGAGEFGRNHVRVWREIEGAEQARLVARVDDRTQDRRADLHDRHACREKRSDAEQLSSGAVALILPVGLD